MYLLHSSGGIASDNRSSTLDVNRAQEPYR
jgi:hypothetical protein